MFADWENDDLRLQPDFPSFKLGCKAIPVEKIGIRLKEPFGLLELLTYRTYLRLQPYASLSMVQGMATITNEKLLAHIQWLESEGKSGRKLDETGMNLASNVLSGLNLARVQFVGTTLTKADLSGTNLSEGDFSGSNFDSANLSGADLSGADLGGVSMRHANLSSARLCGADLSGANLEGANLTEADFTDADLIAANLNKTIQTGLIVKGAKLTDTQGLEVS